MRRVLSLSAVLLLLWAGLCLAATEVVCIVDTDPDAEDAHYHSLADAIAGETGASPKCVSSADLVANDEQLTIECRASSGAADTALILASSLTFVTGPDNYVAFVVPTSHRHEGNWDESCYRLSAYGHTAIELGVGYYRIIGLQIENTEDRQGRTGVGTSGDGASNYLIDSCLIRFSDDATRLCLGVYHYNSNSAAYMTIRNSILLGSPTIVEGSIGVKTFTNGRNYIYNNIIAGFDTGVDRGGGGYACVNNISVGNNTADFAGTWTVASNNISEDTSAPGSNSLTECTPTDLFTDYSNNDFSLKSGADSIDAGIGPALDSNVPTTDIVGTSRSGNTCDIGAFEYVAGPKWNGITPAKWNGVDWSNLKWNGM